MTKYDDLFDFKECENATKFLDEIGFNSTIGHSTTDYFDNDYPYRGYVNDLKKEGYSDPEIANKVMAMEKDIEWRTKLASVQYMQSKLHEMHEIHKTLAGIVDQLHDIRKNTVNLDNDLTNVSDTIAWYVGSVADKLDDED